MSFNRNSDEALGKNLTVNPDAQRPVEPVVIAPEVLDVVRFLAETWAQADAFVYKNCDGESLMHYPVVQGTRNQLNLKKIGQQSYDPARLKAGIEWLLAQ